MLIKNQLIIDCQLKLTLCKHCQMVYISRLEHYNAGCSYYVNQGKF